MDNENQEKGKLATQNGGPGRTPGAAEGDRETVEADLKEKNLDVNSTNQNQDERKSAKSASEGSK